MPEMRPIQEESCSTAGLSRGVNFRMFRSVFSGFLRSSPFQRVRELISFLLVERGHRSIRDRERRDLECALIAFAFANLLLLLAAPARAGIFLNLYFLPVCISAFYLI